MSLNVSVERDEDQILAIYIRVREGKVARTVEIAEGACYADEDIDGNLLGVEMVAPGQVRINVKAVSERYGSKYPAVEELLNSALDTVNV